jgi:ATP-dependent DNA helicase RecG
LRFVQENYRLLSSPLFAKLRAAISGNYDTLSESDRRRWLDAAVAALEIDRVRPSKQPPEKRLARASPQRQRRASSLALDSPVTALAGVSTATAAKLAKLGVSTVRDLIFLFPHRYNDFSSVRPISELHVGEEQTVLASVWTVAATQIGRSRRGTEAIVADETGTLRVLWWGNEYVKNQIKPGTWLALSGKVTSFRGRLQMDSPEYEALGEDPTHTQRLVPVYPLTEGLYARTLRRLVKQAVDAFANLLPDRLPETMRERQKLWPLSQAVRQMHYPDDVEAAEAARRRLAFDELLVIQLGVLGRRKARQEAAGAEPLNLPEYVFDSFLSSLPFALTDAQQRVTGEVLADLQKYVPMSRLLEGDVGSGKTVVALAAMLAAVASKRQAALMAPTELLTEQHFRTLCGLLGTVGVTGPVVNLHPPYLDKPLNLALLTGSLKGRAKSLVQAGTETGQIEIVVGTHALIQREVAFERLGLAVVDEQHRFGVVQRAALRAKSDAQAHLLVMTATPIPRTLALTVYGDLDISVIDQMPPGRKAVKTLRVQSHEREEAYDFIREQTGQGRQAYIICPLIEESEVIEARAAVQEYERLARDVFPDLRLGLLHGRIPAREKDAVMRAFNEGDLDILVSTAVVEVGIDVPNATTILIEGADRFGLAQLHQFRGRVRRSHYQSYCFLLSESASPEVAERLHIMESTDDGFKLAEEDLRLRGPGEYFGTRQSGLPDLRVARLTDVDIIEQARAEAARLLEADPNLTRPEHEPLAQAVRPLWEGGPAEAAALLVT